ncbi:MAG: acyl-CoA thioester hydrolase [Planctomycetota bacterium]|jgi:acyl-CoA thioester hydrolase
MFYRFDTEVPLRWVDVDSAGIINNAVYMSLMEQARYAYFTQLGLLQDHDVPFVLAETTMQFVSPGRLNMPIEVAAATTKLGTTSFHMSYEVRSGEQVLCKATMALVYVDKQMKPTSLPDDFRETLTQFEQLDAE